MALAFSTRSISASLINILEEGEGKLNSLSPYTLLNLVDVCLKPISPLYSSRNEIVILDYSDVSTYPIEYASD